MNSTDVSRPSRAPTDRVAPSGPPPIPGVRRSIVTARGVRFHVTESGPSDATQTLLLLHGWPQHHCAWRHLLSDPPDGMRVIAPDLPGYGWSGPAPHRWAKEDVARDVLALLDALRIDRVYLVGHDWGGWVGHLMVLRAPERVQGYTALNIAHPWNTARTIAPHLWRMALYQPAIAIAGVAVMRHTRFIERIALRAGVSDPDAITPDDARCFGERFRDPVCARAGTDTYRTFLRRELPALARAPETRRATVPIRALFGADDVGIHPSLAAEETANADDYRLDLIPECGHFPAEERPALIRRHVIERAGATR